jgi:hypothetical protein
VWFNTPVPLPETPDVPQPRRRAWVLLLATLLAVGAGALYFWKFSQGLRGAELLHFTSLYITCPLALAVIMIFAYYKYPARP